MNVLQENPNRYRLKISSSMLSKIFSITFIASTDGFNILIRFDIDRIYASLFCCQKMEFIWRVKNKSPFF